MLTTFLQEDKIYVHQPEGFIDPQHPTKVWCLLKSLYGLKQVLLVWNQTINGHLRASGFKPTKANPCVYVCWKKDLIAIIVLYVDDLVIITHSDLLDDEEDIVWAVPGQGSSGTVVDPQD